MLAALQREWLRRGPLAWLLWPLSLLFGALAALRRGAYQAGLLRMTRVSVPVVIVGNVVAGGAGKTPVVMALLDHLRARGIAAGVISRGFGRHTTDCREVRPDSDPHESGDEPLLIARSCDVPLFVARHRAEAAQALLSAYPQTQVIVCDDGLQHYGLKRDIEICVFDERGIGNGWLLPAGPLRERWPRAVDLVLRATSAPEVAGFEVDRELGSHAMCADGSRVPLTQLRGKPVVAVAAIARPEAFFKMLRADGLNLSRTVPLADHGDFAAVVQSLDDAQALVCTEKDAAKLWPHRPDAWAVPLVIRIDNAFWAAFDALLDAKLSSAHGSQTT